MMNALSTSGLTKRYGALVVVDDVSLAVPEGERRAIIGPNGAGKTTLFNLLSGDAAPTRGTVRFGKHDVTALRSAKRVRFGMRRTYQTSSLFDTLTVVENLALAVHGPAGDAWNPWVLWSRGDIVNEAIERTLVEMDLHHCRHTRAADLSHGERRQLELGMAIATRPRMLLLDEPAAGLSTVERATLTRILGELDKEMTILMIEHDMKIALGFADTVTVLSGGKHIAEGPPTRIVEDQAVQRIYLGEQSRG